MENKQNKILIWFGLIDDFINKTGHTGGINVQMYFWAKTFRQKGWSVFTFSENGYDGELDGIRFINNKVPHIVLKLHLGFIQEFFSIFKGVLKNRPDVIFVRGACRALFPLSIMSRIMQIKLVFFGASDVNFVVGRDGHGFSGRLYRNALKNTPYVIVQNKFQQDAYMQYYHRNSLILYNLWNFEDITKPDNYKYDAIWVSNLSPVKQAEIYLDVARSMPKLRFAMVGGVRNLEYYNKIKERARTINNLDFLGYREFSEITNLISVSKALVCTSEHEGFPNTFLQAWSVNVPVISTVNPSNVITEHNLGYFIEDAAEIQKKIEILAEDDNLRDKLSESIKEYFINYHSCERAYSTIINYLYGEK